MNRRAALALFAMGLTLLPACVTKVVVNEPSDAPSTAQVQNSPGLVQAPSNDAIVEIIGRRQDLEIKRRFLKLIQESEFYSRLTDGQESTFWRLGLEACAYFDEGKNQIDWARFQGMGRNEPGETRNSSSGTERLLIAISTYAVVEICPENFNSALNP